MFPKNLNQAILNQLTPKPGIPLPQIGKLIDPRTIQTPALNLIDQQLEWAMTTPDARLIITMPPQEGKTSRVSRDFTIKLLLDDTERRIVIGSYGQQLANRLGRQTRNAILANPQLGLRISQDHGAASEWTLDGHRGGILAVGRGAGVTGNPADALIIDDPLKDRQEADSLTIRDVCWEWWTDALSARLAPGAPVILVLTRWHEDDLAGRLIEHDHTSEWRTLNIAAECEDPETDPLGRELGEFMISARGRTQTQWERRKTTAGPRTWASLYQGRPSPAEGDIFRRKVWKYYPAPRWQTSPDGANWINEGRLIQSWDLAFKEGPKSDYVVGQIWHQDGANAFLLDQVRGQWGFSETCNQIRALSAKWPQAVAKLVEDKANGPAVLDALAREIPGLIPVNPQGGKQARASAVQPLVEAGNIHLPTFTPWVGGLVEEAAGFPNSKHDDQVDTLTQALTYLFLTPKRTGGRFFNIG